MTMSEEDRVALQRLRKNAPAIITDIALGVAFFIVAKLTDLTTAAYFGVAAGIALVIVQRFVTVDLLGGMALFGVAMLGVSAVFATVFTDESIIKLRSTFIGGLSAVLFLSDGFLVRGRMLGQRMRRYMPSDGVDPRRLAIGIGFITATVAAVNYVLAVYASENIWLFYTTFGDIVLAVILFSIAGRYIGITPGGSSK